MDTEPFKGTKYQLPSIKKTRAKPEIARDSKLGEVGWLMRVVQFVEARRESMTWWQSMNTPPQSIPWIMTFTNFILFTSATCEIR